MFTGQFYEKWVSVRERKIHDYSIVIMQVTVSVVAMYAYVHDPLQRIPPA